MKIIQSLSNDTVKAVVALHTPRERQQKQLFLAEGIRTIETFLQNNYQIQDLYATEEQVSRAQTMVHHEKIALVSAMVMQKISTLQTPPGLLAVFHIPTTPLVIEHGIVLAHIADPGNMGTLLRTAAAMGAKTAVIVEGCDPWSPKVIQASAGTMSHLQIITCSWEELIARKKDTHLCALVVKDGLSTKNIPHQRSLIVVGNEAQGLPEAWAAACDQRITLAMPGMTESLNVGVAGSIALYLMYVENSSN